MLKSCYHSISQLMAFDEFYAIVSIILSLFSIVISSNLS